MMAIMEPAMVMVMTMMVMTLVMVGREMRRVSKIRNTTMTRRMNPRRCWA